MSPWSCHHSIPGCTEVALTHTWLFWFWTAVFSLYFSNNIFNVNIFCHALPTILYLMRSDWLPGARTQSPTGHFRLVWAHTLTYDFWELFSREILVWTVGNIGCFFSMSPSSMPAKSPRQFLSWRIASTQTAADQRGRGKRDGCPCTTSSYNLPHVCQFIALEPRFSAFPDTQMSTGNQAPFAYGFVHFWSSAISLFSSFWTLN